MDVIPSLEALLLRGMAPWVARMMMAHAWMLASRSLELQLALVFLPFWQGLWIAEDLVLRVLVAWFHSTKFG
jgi:hypothetical protein